MKNDVIRAKKLSSNGTIGMFCPSHVANMEIYDTIISTIEGLGYMVKLGHNFTGDSYGYAASTKERADDLNDLVADKNVEMILFSGGQSAAEVLPYINYENIRQNPKIFSSYSDATSILNAVYAKTGLVTYYGFGAGEFFDLSYHDYDQFHSNFVNGEANSFSGKFKVLNGGRCEGTLIGGYTALFGLMLANPFFSYNPKEKYLLFLEDHERFSNIGSVATYLAFIGQSRFICNVTGLIFGHYSENTPSELFSCLERFGKTYNIPVVYTDEFGHGKKHAILPIGETASLDTDMQTLVIQY